MPSIIDGCSNNTMKTREYTKDGNEKERERNKAWLSIDLKHNTLLEQN